MGKIAEVSSIQPIGCCCKAKLYCPHCGGRVTNAFCPGETGSLYHCGACGCPWVLRGDEKGSYFAAFPRLREGLLS